MILVTHVATWRPDGDRQVPRVLVTGKQLLATHDMYRALSLTGVTLGATGDAPLLFYLNRSHIGLLGGFLGPLRRAIIENRMRGDTPEILHGLRTRLESGPPPARER